jgi:hypothetical protein
VRGLQRQAFDAGGVLLDIVQAEPFFLFWNIPEGCSNATKEFSNSGMVAHLNPHMQSR